MTVQTTTVDPFEDVKNALAPYSSQQFHRLVPTALQERSPLFRPALAIVKVNAEDARDVYPTPGAKDGTVCLHTQTLERIGNALGIDWIRTDYERDRAEPYLCTAHVSAEYIDAVGQRRRINASATTDVRDGSILAQISKPQQLQTARQYIAERTEARARNRIVRKVTGMQSSFRKEELAKPFVALRWRLDESDPDVKAAIIANGVSAATGVFGRRDIETGRALGPERPAIVEDAGHDDPEDEIQGSFVDATAAVEEPPIPDDAPAASVVSPTPASADTSALDYARAYFQQKLGELRWGEDRKRVAASDAQLGTVAMTFRDVFGLRDRASNDQLIAARLAVVRAIYGAEITTTRQLTSAQASVLIDAGKDFAGQEQLRVLFAHVLATDAKLAGLAAALNVEQGTLAEAAKAL